MDSQFKNLKIKEDDLINEIKNLQESENIFEYKNRHLISNYENIKKTSSKIVSNPNEVKEEIKTIINVSKNVP